MKKHNIILIILISVIIPASLSTWGLTETSEARYAEISKEMYNSGDYLHPSYLVIYHYHKPPLTYYITAAGYAIFGVNETGTRFFLMISLLIQLWLVYKICLLFFQNKQVALGALLIYFSFPIVQAAAKNLTTDNFLTSFIFAAIYSFILYRRKQKIIYLYLFYIFCGFAFLTKGPVGVMPQALFAIFYSRSYPWQQSTGFHQYTALLLGLIISFSWFLLLILNEPGLFNYFTGHQLVDRVASDAFNRAKPWWYYLAMIPLLALPVFIYFFDWLRTILLNKPGTLSPAASIPLWSLFISLLIFSLSSSKLVLYVMPLYLFIAMLSARHLFNMTIKGIKTTEKVLLFFFCIIFIALSVACFIDLPLQVPVIPILPLAVTGIALIILIYLRKDSWHFLKGPVLSATGIALLTLIMPFIMKRNELAINSLKPLTSFILTNQTANKKSRIAVYNYLLPSLSFYTDMKVITFDNGNSTAHREIQFESNKKEWKENYVQLAGLKDSSMLTNIFGGTGNFLIARKIDDLPDSLSYLKQDLPHRIEMGKWIVYY